MNFNFFGFGSTSKSTDFLPDLYPMPIILSAFISTDVESIYSKILTDVAERTQGIPDESTQILWDNCLQSETNDGLITLLAKAMETKNDLFLVFKDGLKTLRKADSTEQNTIKADYAKEGKSKAGVYISFKNYKKTDMVKLYSALEYAAVASLHKNMNLAKATQYKINDLRSTVSLKDSAEAEAQALKIAGALSKGKDVYMDGKDTIDSHKPDLDSTKQSIEFIESKRCFYLGLPVSYITGELSGGLGDTGKGDARAVERGLKNYFNSIMKPVLEALFPEKTIEFKSQDFDLVDSAINALKVFELVGDRYLSGLEKRMVLVKMLDLDDEADSAPDLKALKEPPPPKPIQALPGAAVPPAKVTPPA